MMDNAQLVSPKAFVLARKARLARFYITIIYTGLIKRISTYFAQPTYSCRGLQPTSTSHFCWSLSLGLLVLVGLELEYR